MLESKYLPRDITFSSCIETKRQSFIKVLRVPTVLENWSSWHFLHGFANGVWKYKITVMRVSNVPMSFETEVKYFDKNGNQRIQRLFSDSIAFFSGSREKPFTAGVWIRFKGHLGGQVIRVRVEIEP
ncbi:MAG: hypothetical protein IH995_04485 [Proteobacteria bacterium]|nr:hypothetical protein [Pseudomonadota bacterium]MCH8172333.1 hypothetical protein [Pseudomonadota bacterium]